MASKKKEIPMRLITTAAATAAITLSSVLSPAFADVTDVWHLGVDTSNAGNTHDEVQKFLDTLQPEARKAVVDGCQHILKDPEQTQDRSAMGSARTIEFCKLAL
jgi:hypothetical protein